MTRRTRGLFRNLCGSLLVLIVAVASVGAKEFAYVGDIVTDSVVKVDTATNTVTATLALGHEPHGVAFTPDGSFAYIANALDNTVSVIDVASRTVVGSIGVGSAPQAFGIFIAAAP